MKRITIDTNIVRDYLESTRAGHHDAVKLFALMDKGELDIAVTTRIDADVPTGALRAKINAINALSTKLPSLARWDVSEWDSDVWASDEDEEECKALLELLFPGSVSSTPQHNNRLADIDHLISHRMSGRVAFLTSEKAILQQQQQLKGRHGVVVKSVREFLSEYGP